MQHVDKIMLEAYRKKLEAKIKKNYFVECSRETLGKQYTLPSVFG
jgi:hypothetical protein